MTVRDAERALECWRDEQKRGVAAGGRNRIENLGGGLDEARCGLSVCGCGKQCEIDCAPGAGYECVGKGCMVGNFLQLCEKGDVVRGEDAQFEDDGGGPGLSRERVSRRRPHMEGRAASSRITVEVVRDSPAKRVRSRV